MLGKPDHAGEHLVGGPHYHCVWDNSLEPRLTVESGAIVLFKCVEAAGGQFTPESTVEDLRNLDVTRIHTLTGPVAVTGAEPGDTLRVDLLDFAHEGWAWTTVEPGFGTLASEFGGEYALRIWRVDDEGYASFIPGLRVPVNPFCGVMGVAPSTPGAFITIPPRSIGGNMDCKHLRAGSAAFFPVQVPGALFSLGDGHLAQGDGEVCGTALEAPVSVKVKFTVLKGLEIDAVRIETASSAMRLPADQGEFVTTAAGDDIQTLVRTAVSRMVDLLTEQFSVSRMDAYIVCSAAGDLKIAVPVLGARHAAMVTFHVAKALFGPELSRKQLS